jgi:hypothetical protein
MAVRRIVEKKSAVRFIGLFLNRSKELIVGPRLGGRSGDLHGRKPILPGSVRTALRQVKNGSNH